MPIQALIDTNGIMYQVERNGSIVSNLKGFPNHEKSTSKKYVAFMPDSDIQHDDWIINPANERLFISDVLTSFIQGEKSHLKAYYKTMSEHNSEAKATNIFNIGNASNSVIGTQSVVTMNITSSIQEAKERINSSDSDDKEDLKQIINLLEMVVNNQVPAQGGLLSKFSSVIQRNAWISSPISSIVLNWLITQVH